MEKKYKVICDQKHKIIDEKEKDDISSEAKTIESILEKDKRCAPGKKYSGGTCFSFETLLALVNGFNSFIQKVKKNPKEYEKYKEFGKKEPIKLQFSNKGFSDPEKKKYKKYLIIHLDDRLKDICSDQTCWLKQKFIEEMENQYYEDAIHNTFVPKGPQGKFTWLNTTNLDEVMAQWENFNKKFRYLKTVPIDFDSLPDDYKLSSYNYQNLYDQGIRQLGVIFNLDEHYKDGSHWVALFADMSGGGSVEFSDSVGRKPDPRIKKLINKLTDFMKNDLKKNPVIKINETEHQKGDSECGVYSINFLVRRLGGDTFEKIHKKEVDDSKINICRKVYFT